MRICRFVSGEVASTAFYFDERILPFEMAARLYRDRTHKQVDLPPAAQPLDCLPPEGKHLQAAQEAGRWFQANLELVKTMGLETAKVRLLIPIAQPPKLLLLAGNYASHLLEGGQRAVERSKTFPYVFMKPVATTLNHPGAPVPIPRVSPNAIDWEVELGVILGKRARGVSEAEALSFVGGYTVVNDISDRKFRPNPGREPRERDAFFDWLHGKWHDGFCPVGPCVLPAHALPDPQQSRLTLKLNGAIKQDATTAQQIFPVAAVIAFISSFVTLEPGDIISTGTPAGVGNTTGTYLRPGDRLEAAIEGIGVLHNHMVAEP